VVNFVLSTSLFRKEDSRLSLGGWGVLVRPTLMLSTKNTLSPAFPTGPNSISPLRPSGVSGAPWLSPLSPVMAIAPLPNETCF